MHPASSHGSRRMRIQWSTHGNWSRTQDASRRQFQGSSFMGPVYRDPRAAGPGGKHLGLQLGKVLCHRGRSQWQSTRASAQKLSDQCPQPGKKVQKEGAGRPTVGRTNIASCLFTNGRGHQKRRRRLRSLKGRTSRGDYSVPFGKWQQYWADIFGAHPPSAAESGGDRVHGASQCRAWSR